MASTKQEARRGGTQISDLSLVVTQLYVLKAAHTSHTMTMELKGSSSKGCFVYIHMQNMFEYMEWQQGKKIEKREEKIDGRKKYAHNRK